MSIDVEYAIKKDIRNNPVVRAVDAQQKREFVRSILLGTFVVTALLFSAWQHQRMTTFGSQIEALKSARVNETELNRKLRLNFETARAPQTIDLRARRDLHLIAPTTKDTLVIERAPMSTAAHAVVASR